MADYMKLIGANHPTVEANCEGDTSDYNNITFITGSVTKATLDGEWLAFYKDQRNAAIDKKTNELCLSGFLWNNISFSTSETAQRNWLALKVFSAIIVYPKRISTLDGDHYDLADETELLNFTGYCLGVIEGRHAAGVALRDQVNAATDEAGVDAVVDNR